jgi:3-oxoacyl-[acyl-carrier protein] reductase
MEFGTGSTRAANREYPYNKEAHFMRFVDKRVIITGAAGAVGSGIVAAFAAEGARVCLSDLRAHKAEAVARALNLPEDRYLVHETDVRTKASTDELVEAVCSAWGGVDVLVNAAGLYPDNMLMEMSESDWDRVLDTNLRGPCLLSQAVGRRLIAQGTGGKIVNITSGAAESTRPGAVHYSVSKAGLAMLTRGLALELSRHGINVNSVAPGLTMTDGEVNPLSTAYMDALVETIPLGRLCLPEDTAKAVLFVCSEDAAFITGSTIKVDGGRTAGNFKLPRSNAQQ